MFIYIILESEKDRCYDFVICVKRTHEDATNWVQKRKQEVGSKRRKYIHHQILERVVT